MTFLLGQKVQWWINPPGYYRHGVIVQVVAPGKRPWRKHKLKEPGMSRDVESCVVRSEGKCYWPRTAQVSHEVPTVQPTGAAR